MVACDNMPQSGISRGKSVKFFPVRVIRQVIRTAHQVECCNVIGICVAAPLPGNVEVEACACTPPGVIHLARARVEAIAPAELWCFQRSKVIR
jgi:hypothetical protein